MNSELARLGPGERAYLQPLSLSIPRRGCSRTLDVPDYSPSDSDHDKEIYQGVTSASVQEINHFMPKSRKVQFTSNPDLAVHLSHESRPASSSISYDSSELE